MAVDARRGATSGGARQCIGGRSLDDEKKGRLARRWTLGVDFEAVKRSELELSRGFIENSHRSFQAL